MSKKPDFSPNNTDEAIEQIMSDEEVDSILKTSAAPENDQRGEETGDSGKVKISTVASLKIQLGEAEKKALRYQADLDNFRRRTVRENEDKLKYAAMPVFTDLLEVVDNLDRALEACAADETASGLVDGVKLVALQLNGVFEKNGCKKIPSVGHPFDPNLHEAIQMQASSEFESGVVMMEVRSGYQLNGRVVRPSQVFVSTGPDSNTDSE